MLNLLSNSRKHLLEQPKAIEPNDINSFGKLSSNFDLMPPYLSVYPSLLLEVEVSLSPLTQVRKNSFWIYKTVFWVSVDCGWSSWTQWSSCSRTCDVGVRRRYRSGTNPPPAFGGRPCKGVRVGIDTCSIEPCLGKRDLLL